ncbi:MAG TPA: glycosyltransferase family 9 protein, partial [Myxococcaceae bacterium]|nr:glycosyltransferase family 9 protein [Myxococcaceae bacterium]
DVKGDRMQPWHKRLEGTGKRALARVAALAFRRPAGALPSGVRRVLLVRIDDRVGQALLMTPLATALKRLRPTPDVDLLVHQRTARVLEGHPDMDRLFALDRRFLALGALAPGIRAVRSAGPWDVVVDCGNWEIPGVTSALVSRLVAGTARVIGPAVAPTGPLHDVAVPARPDTQSELAQRLHLLSPLLDPPALLPTFRAPRVPDSLVPVLDQVRAGPHAVLVPGGRLGWRRIPPELFAVAGRALAELGRTVVVAWGPGEEELAASVVAAVPGAQLAPPTDLDGLAALLAAARCTVCNNSGPMHLSVAVGAPTLALFLRMDPERWGYLERPHAVLELTSVLENATRAGEAMDRAVRGWLG